MYDFNSEYAIFKSSLTNLNRLELFKIPFVRFYEDFIFSYGETDKSDNDNCEFYNISDIIEPPKDIDCEIEETATKLTELLAAKERQLKNNLKNYIKK